MGAWVKILSVLADVITSVSSWWKERKRRNEVDKINKSVDSGDDVYIALKLREIADKIENRNKTN